MRLPRRKRASLVLLLVLAAGLAAAGAAAASGTQDMACCPVATSATGCTWLGASDCCPERPTAPAPASAVVTPPGVFALTAPPGAGLAPTALSPAAPTLPIPTRGIVLRL